MTDTKIILYLEEVNTTILCDHIYDYFVIVYLLVYVKRFNSAS